MSHPWRIYYNIVFGGIGGLLAWLFVGSLPDLIQNAIFWKLLTGAFARVDSIDGVCRHPLR